MVVVSEARIEDYAERRIVEVKHRLETVIEDKRTHRTRRYGGMTEQSQLSIGKGRQDVRFELEVSGFPWSWYLIKSEPPPVLRPTCALAVVGRRIEIP